jgi:threonine dehydratase
MGDIMSPEINSPHPDSMVTLKDVREAYERLKPHLDSTPLAHSTGMSKLWGCDVWFKLENLHETGSFKERGALNRLLQLGEEARAKGVISASAGNHGRALAHHAQRLEIPCTIVMPVNSPLIKVQNTRACKARVVLHGSNFDEAAEKAREICTAESLTYVHGFDDPYVICGQGTCGLEIMEEVPDFDMIVMGVGGGGLIAGVSMAVKELRPDIKVVGVQFEGIPSMTKAMTMGHPVTVAPHRTIADGIAVRQVGGLCLDLVNRYVDEIVTVSEAEIANAILLMLEREKTVVEGAGAVGVAAMHNGLIKASGKKVCVVLSGGNIDVNVLARVIEKGLVKDGRLVRLQVVVPDYPGQLARILDTVAECRANILEINHARAFSPAQVGETMIDIILETRGEDHISEIQAALSEQSISTERR